MKDIHLHIWSKDVETWDDGPEEEVNLEYFDQNDEYIQYKATLEDGRHLELRVPKD